MFNIWLVMSWSLYDLDHIFGDHDLITITFSESHIVIWSDLIHVDHFFGDHRDWASI